MCVEGEGESRRQTARWDGLDEVPYSPFPFAYGGGSFCPSNLYLPSGVFSFGNMMDVRQGGVGSGTIFEGVVVLLLFFRFQVESPTSFTMKWDTNRTLVSTSKFRPIRFLLRKHLIERELWVRNPFSFIGRFVAYYST